MLATSFVFAIPSPLKKGKFKNKNKTLKYPPPPNEEKNEKNNNNKRTKKL